MFQHDHSLWQLFRTGNRAAFEQLISQHYRHLMHFGSKFTNDREIVKDTIQELFINLWEKRDNLSYDANPQAYLTASLRRALHRKIQSMERRSNITADAAFFDMEVSIEDKLIKQEYGRMLSRTIAQKLSVLPARQKEVVYLKYFGEFNRDGISEVMGISTQTVSNLLQMAMKNLRARVSRDMLV